MEKILGLSYYKHNNQLCNIGLYDKNTNEEYDGIFKLDEEKIKNRFSKFKKNYDITIPISDSLVQKIIPKIGKLNVINFSLNDFLKDFSLEEWMI